MSAPEQLPFDANARKVMERALLESEAMNHPRIGTEHLLLGVADVNEGIAPRVLHDLGVSGPTVREATLRAFEGDLR